MRSERFKTLMAEYGRTAIGVWFAIFFLTLGVLMAAISMGISVKGATAGAGAFVAAYGVTKLLMPVRLAATVFLTPLVARVIRRKVAEKAEAEAGDVLDKPLAPLEPPAVAQPDAPSSPGTTSPRA